MRPVPLRPLAVSVTVGCGRTPPTYMPPGLGPRADSEGRPRPECKASEEQGSRSQQDEAFATGRQRAVVPSKVSVDSQNH